MEGIVKKTFAFLGLMFVLAVAAGFLSTACNSVQTNPVSVTIVPTNTKVPTATPTSTVCSVQANNDASSSVTLQLNSGDVVAIPFVTVTATTAKKVGVYFFDIGTFNASDVLKTALYKVSAAGTSASLVAGTGSSQLISAPVTTGYTTMSF